MTPEQRAQAIYDAVVLNGLPRTFAHNGVEVIVVSARLIGPAVECILSDATGSLGIDNPYTFVNPPCGVWDGEDVVIDANQAAAEIICGAVSRG